MSYSTVLNLTNYAFDVLPCDKHMLADSILMLKSLGFFVFVHRVFTVGASTYGVLKRLRRTSWMEWSASSWGGVISSQA